MEEIDLNAVPFAGWLEEAIPALCRMDVKCIGMVAILKDGGVATNFWEANTNDMAAMGYRIMEEGVLNTLRMNGRELKEIIDNAERAENDEGKEGDDGIFGHGKRDAQQGLQRTVPSGVSAAQDPYGEAEKNAQRLVQAEHRL